MRKETCSTSLFINVIVTIFFTVRFVSSYKAGLIVEEDTGAILVMGIPFFLNIGLYLYAKSNTPISRGFAVTAVVLNFFSVYNSISALILLSDLPSKKVSRNTSGSSSSSSYLDTVIYRNIDYSSVHRNISNRLMGLFSGMKN